MKVMSYLQPRRYYYSDEEYVLMTWIRSLLHQKDTSLSSYEGKLMTQVALTDLTNYLLVKWNIIKRPTAELLLRERLGYELYKRPIQLREFIDEWLDFWLIKWRQRVRIVFSEKELEELSLKNTMMDVDPIVNRSKDLMKKLFVLLMPKLINVLEICFTNTILDGLIRAEIKRLIEESTLRESNLDTKIRYVTKNWKKIYRRVANRISELPRVKMPLIVLRVDGSLLSANDVKPLVYT